MALKQLPNWKVSRSWGATAVSPALREGFPPQVTGEPVRVDELRGINEAIRPSGFPTCPKRLSLRRSNCRQVAWKPPVLALKGL
ncbi:MAG: hypothetical protein V7K48_06960 [Nostoc sp.]|uniref:hypothetical protein n=1 Tax=Nostoc sp. TaxID=1180 RepID=UPI002FFD4C67